MFQTLYAPDSGVYLEQINFVYDTPINESAFRQAWERVMQAYPVMRTSFFWENLEKPVQIVHRRVAIPWETFDWRNLRSNEREERIQAYLTEDRRRGFNLSKAPMMRFVWIRLESNLYRFIWTFHHAILDGWSVQLVIKKLAEYYQAIFQGKIIHDEVTRPYADYIEWLRQQDQEEAANYWRNTLKGITAPTPFNVDHNTVRAADPADGFSEQHILISRYTTSALNALCKKQRLTLNTFIQGAWALLLHHYSTEDDVLFGTVVSGRPADLAGVESMVGLFINTQPTRVHIDSDCGLIQWLQAIQQQQFTARKYEYSHLIQIQEVSEIPRGEQLFESVLVFENFPVNSSWESQKKLQQGSGLLERTNLPLTIMILPASEVLIKILYDCSRFDAETIKRMLSHYQAVLDNIANRPDAVVEDLTILTKAETRRLLIEWNDTDRDYQPQNSILEMFAAQCVRAPDSTAFVYGEEHLSYAELERRTNQLANYLQTIGVSPGTTVGVCLERSLDLVVALLSVFRTGGIYLPLDPVYPQSRLAFMLDDSRAQLLLTNTSMDAGLQRPGLTMICLDELADEIAQQSESAPDIYVEPSSPAYIIYTSGSTGLPKGVLAPHRQLLNRLSWMYENYPFKPGEVGCQKTALSFVDSLWELMGPLLKGVPTVIISDTVLRDPGALVDVLGRQNVTRIWVVPTLLRMLLDSVQDLAGKLPRLRFWVSSGEALTVDLARRFKKAMPEANLYNLYGTSEVWDVTWYDLEDKIGDQACVPIGTPIANVKTYVLDRLHRPVPVGVPGELYVSGAGLATGYIHDDALTQERFVSLPMLSRDEALAYRTGDLARYLPDGNLQLLGRLDGQVKVRGYRVEPGEVEAVLVTHPQLGEAAVIQDPNSEDRLIAYVVARSESIPTSNELRHWLLIKLPEHMVPAAVVEVDSFPLTPSGKVDRRALQAISIDRPSLEQGYEPPRTEVEKQLAQIWSEILKLERVGIYDSFFDLGGHSLTATQVVTRICSTFGTDLTLRAFFQLPTIANLAEIIEASTQQQANLDAPAITRVERDKYKTNI